MTTFFCLSKSHQNKRAQVTSKLHQKLHRNNFDFSSFEIRSKKIHRNDANILLIKITPHKVRQNDVYLLLIEIILNKVRQNGVEIHQFFLFDLSTLVSTLNRRRFDVVCLLGNYFCKPFHHRCLTAW